MRSSEDARSGNFLRRGEPLRRTKAEGRVKRLRNSKAASKDKITRDMIKTWVS